MSFDEFLEKFLIPYRHDIMAQYKTSPLLLGGAGRQFKIFTPVFQTLGIGPRFLPVPGGAFSDQQNQVKFPASTRNIDVLESWENNLALDPLGTSVLGARVPDGHEWHADSVTLAAGGGVILTGNAITELKINTIIIEPDTDLNIQALVFVFSCSAGNLLGQNDNIHSWFLFDIVTPAYNNLGMLVLNFPSGIRTMNEDPGVDILVGIAGGSGNENTTYFFESRDLA